MNNLPTSRDEFGEVNPLLIATILLGVIAVALGAFSTWSYINYQDQKNNTDAKIETAVSAAKEEQARDLETKFAEQEKLPYREFVGPNDLGEVRFNYPKTWSLYVNRDGSRGDYEAFFYPISVPTVDRKTAYATRIIITDDAYAEVLEDYEDEVEDGTLRSKPITVNGLEGVRLDGSFSDERKGSLAIFKVRDKTLQVATDAQNFLNDYNDVVIKSLKFNP